MADSGAALSQLAARWAGDGGLSFAQAPAEALGTFSLSEGLRGAGAGAGAGVDAAAPAAPTDGAALPSAASLAGEGSLERVAACAVSLAFLTDFYEAAVAPLADGAALTTKQVVETIIIPATQARRCSFAQLVPAAVAPPTAFASHAFGNPFSLLVAALREHFANAVAAEVFVWLDVFAINQHDPGADLHGGRALVRTIDLAAETLVVLDRTALPMSRLWCLYEIGSTPPDKLLLLTHGFSEAEVATTFRGVDVEAARCFDDKDTNRIREHIVAQHGSLAAFQQMLRLRLLLKPMSYEADCRALLARSTDDEWRFDELRGFITAGSSLQSDRSSGVAAAPAIFQFAAGSTPSALEPIATVPCSTPSSATPNTFGAGLPVSFDFGAPAAVNINDIWRAAAPAFAGATVPSTAVPAANGESRLACIAGGPGEGKSSIAAALCAPASPLLVHAHHFCKATDMRRQDVVGIIRSLAYQLSLRFPVFADELLSLSAAEAETLSDPQRAYELLLKQPLSKLKRGTRVVLLFDALDEAKGDVNRRALSKVLALVMKLGRLQLGGAALSVIVTTRPEEGIVAPLRSCWRTNCRDFAPAALRADGDAQSKLIRLLRSQLPTAGVGSSVDDAFATFFAAAPGDDAERVTRLLSILVAASQPPSMAQLEALGLRSACSSLPALGLLFEERDHCVHLLHESLREWLTDATRSGRFSADLAAGHADWAANLSSQLRPWLEPADGCAPAPAPPKGSYAYAHTLPHLDAAGRGDEARALLLRLPWLQATLRERGIFALLSDVAARMVGGNDPLSLLYRTLRLSAPGLQGADAAEALPSQLVGRLGGLLDTAAPAVVRLYDEAYQWRGSLAWLRPIRPTLRQPAGTLEMCLHGHTGDVTALVALSDGRVVSGSEDCTLRVWNATTGECERTLMGHTNSVQSLVALSDSRVVSGSEDQTVQTLRVWNAATGECVLTLPGGLGRFTQLVELGDGRIVSAWKYTWLRVWNAAMDVHVCTLLKGHTSAVCSLVALGDGRVVSGSFDHTVRVWNLATCICERTLEGHTSPVWFLAALDDRRVVSAASNETLRVWNTDTY